MTNLIDQHCLDLFPEMLEHFDKKPLEEASQIGSYIFHEDFFLRFALAQGDEVVLRRIAVYIEELARSENKHIRNLAQIALIEGLINANFTIIAPYFSETSQEMIREASSRIKFRAKDWLRNPQG